jgi:cytochrome c oxidase assembly factor CtaG
VIFEVLPGIGMVVAGLLYLRGVTMRYRGTPRWRIVSFYGGLVAAALAIYGGIGHLAEATFSGHMIQHVILMSVAAPAIVVGDAGRVLRAGSPRAVLRAMGLVPARVRAGIRNPFVAMAAFTVVLWAWHLPVLYEIALRQPAFHALEHLSFVATSLLLWSVVFGKRRASDAVALLVVFVTSLAGAALGAIIALAGSVLYPIHAVIAAASGIDALVDQQLAGAIMWIPPGVLNLLAMVVITARLIGGERPSHAGAGSDL